MVGFASLHPPYETTKTAYSALPCWVGKGLPMDRDDPTLPDLDALRFEPLATRPSKVRLADLGRPTGANPRLNDWLDALPTQLGAADLRRLRDAIVTAHEG